MDFDEDKKNGSAIPKKTRPSDGGDLRHEEMERKKIELGEFRKAEELKKIEEIKNQQEERRQKQFEDQKKAVSSQHKQELERKKDSIAQQLRAKEDERKRIERELGQAKNAEGQTSHELQALWMKIESDKRQLSKKEKEYQEKKRNLQIGKKGYEEKEAAILRLGRDISRLRMEKQQADRDILSGTNY